MTTMAKQLKQCLDMLVEINEFSVSDEMLRVTGQTGRRQVDCSRVIPILFAAIYGNFMPESIATQNHKKLVKVSNLKPVIATT